MGTTAQQVREDARQLRVHAAGLTYNDTAAEAVAKHRLHEIAMRLETVSAERDRLHALINSPQTDEFLSAVRAEQAHQVERWGAAHDRSKSAQNWFWLVGYLAGKALRAAITGDRDKALHHCVSSAAALGNWFAAIKADTSGCGQGADVDIAPKEDGGRAGEAP